MDFGEQYNFGGSSSGGGGLFDLNFSNSSGANNFGSITNDYGGGFNGGYTDFTGVGLDNYNPNNFSQNSQGFSNYDFSQPTMPQGNGDAQSGFGMLDMDNQVGGGLGNLFGSRSQGGPWAAQDLGGAGTDPIPTQAQAGEEGWGLGGIGDYLSKMFNNPKAISGIIGALVEGQQNKRQASSQQKIVQQQQAQQLAERQAMIERQNQQQQVVSPYDRASAANNGDSMRNAMQQKLMEAMQNPYQVPIVQQQVDAMTQAQRRKDAAAGRRSNDATSNPQLLAEQAKIAQNYIQNLQGPAGANIAPNYPGLNQNVNNNGSLQALLNASTYETNGTLSPLLSALGFAQASGSAAPR